MADVHSWHILAEIAPQQEQQLVREAELARPFEAGAQPSSMMMAIPHKVVAKLRDMMLYLQRLADRQRPADSG